MDSVESVSTGYVLSSRSVMLSRFRDAQQMQRAVRKLSRQAVLLPVIGLPVPKQQVSESVPRGQREHLLFQFDHD